LLFLFGIPSSSRWLVTQNRLEEAREVLRLIGSPDSDAELKEIVESIHFDRAHRHEHVFKKKYLFPIFLAISIGMFNQLSGINAVLYYLNDIFYAAGFRRVSSDLQAVWIGATNLGATLLGMSLVDKLGRKALLLIGSAGMVVCLTGVAMLFLHHQHSGLLLWFLIGFIAFFAISQGAVIWVYISEVFPNRVRSKGQSIGSSAHWITNAAIAGIFPTMATRSGAYPFFFFASMMALQFVVVMFIYPETKGISLEKIQAKLGID
jgi:SP family arabinose:H+ symporter-like MFS transporter